MGPITRKRFKIYLNPEVYELFRIICKKRGKRRVNRIIEAFMAYCIENPVLIEFICKQKPAVFHEPTKKEKRAERIRKMIREVEALLRC